MFLAMSSDFLSIARLELCTDDYFVLVWLVLTGRVVALQSSLPKLDTLLKPCTFFLLFLPVSL